jgi:DNA replication and repair protein RecF
MRIESLTAHAFRNLKSVSIRPQAPCIVLEGDNAQGKTNILEALYLCATGRSFRRATAKEMITHGHTQSRCEALLQRQGVRHTVQVDLLPLGTSGSMRQKLQVDGRLLRQSSALLTLVNVVAFFPDDLRIVKGSPEERRRFFDRAVAGGQPPFVEATLSYHRALKARNVLLRQPQTPDKRMVAVYDSQLVQHGAIMHALRVEALAEVAQTAQNYFAELMNGHTLQLGLISGVSAYDEQRPQGAQGFAAIFAETLARNYPRDRARGLTLSGPHRSDLGCGIDGQAARAHASQGQQRALVLALKLAELTHLAQRLQTPPILLLDDVSSELDANRTRLLFALLARLGSQVWVSTTGSVPLPIQTASQRLRIRGGSVHAEG